MAGREIKLLTQAFPDRVAFDTGVSHAILRRVAAGEAPETVRLHQPGRIVAFGRQDTVATGYGEAVAATQAVWIRTGRTTGRRTGGCLPRRDARLLLGHPGV